METIQIVLDTELLMAVDQMSKQEKINRSALIRRALREHLQRCRTEALEDRDRRGYAAAPQRTEEYQIWENAAAWPEN